jgi:hypothetical protein
MFFDRLDSRPAPFRFDSNSAYSFQHGSVLNPMAQCIWKDHQMVLRVEPVEYRVITHRTSAWKLVWNVLKHHGLDVVRDEAPAPMSEHPTLWAFPVMLTFNNDAIHDNGTLSFLFCWICVAITIC